MKLSIKEAPALYKKGIKYVVEIPIKELCFEGINDVKRTVYEAWKELSQYIENRGADPIFIDCEDIGTNYIIYRFRILLGEEYIGCRVVTHKNRGLFIIFTVGGSIKWRRFPLDRG